MPNLREINVLVFTLLQLLILPQPSIADSWTQLEGNATRSGNAPHVSLEDSLGLLAAVPDGGEDTLYRVGRTDVLPVFRREVVESQQLVAVFHQLGHGLLIFHAIGFNEEIEGGIRFLLGLGLLIFVEN